MKVLVACESSGTIREAFRKLGHEAWSNDMLPADDDSPYHIQGDCVAAIKSQTMGLNYHASTLHCSSSLRERMVRQRNA